MPFLASKADINFAMEGSDNAARKASSAQNLGSADVSRWLWTPAPSMDPHVTKGKPLALDDTETETETETDTDNDTDNDDHSEHIVVTDDNRNQSNVVDLTDEVKLHRSVATLTDPGAVTSSAYSQLHPRLESHQELRATRSDKPLSASLPHVSIRIPPETFLSGGSTASVPGLGQGKVLRRSQTSSTVQHYPAATPNRSFITMDSVLSGNSMPAAGAQGSSPVRDTAGTGTARATLKWQNQEADKQMRSQILQTIVGHFRRIRPEVAMQIKKHCKITSSEHLHQCLLHCEAVMYRTAPSRSAYLDPRTLQLRMTKFFRILNSTVESQRSERIAPDPFSPAGSTASVSGLKRGNTLSGSQFPSTAKHSSEASPRYSAFNGSQASNRKVISQDPISIFDSSLSGNRMQAATAQGSFPVRGAAGATLRWQNQEVDEQMRSQMLHTIVGRFRGTKLEVAMQIKRHCKITSSKHLHQCLRRCEADMYKKAPSRSAYLNPQTISQRMNKFFHLLRARNVTKDILANWQTAPYDAMLYISKAEVVKLLELTIGAQEISGQATSTTTRKPAAVVSEKAKHDAGDLYKLISKLPPKERNDMLLRGLSSRIFEASTLPLEFKFPCSAAGCSECFSTLADLREHQVVHLPWSCRWCTNSATPFNDRRDGPDGKATLCPHCWRILRCGYGSLPYETNSENRLVCRVCGSVETELGRFASHVSECSGQVLPCAWGILSPDKIQRTRLLVDADIVRTQDTDTGGEDAVSLPAAIPAAKLQTSRQVTKIGELIEAWSVISGFQGHLVGKMHCMPWNTFWQAICSPSGAAWQLHNLQLFVVRVIWSDFRGLKPSDVPEWFPVDSEMQQSRDFGFLDEPPKSMPWCALNIYTWQTYFAELLTSRLEKRSSNYMNIACWWDPAMVEAPGIQRLLSLRNMLVSCEYDQLDPAIRSSIFVELASLLMETRALRSWILRMEEESTQIASTSQQLASNCKTDETNAGAADDGQRQDTVRTLSSLELLKWRSSRPSSRPLIVGRDRDERSYYLLSGPNPALFVVDKDFQMWHNLCGEQISRTAASLRENGFFEARLRAVLSFFSSIENTSQQERVSAPISLEYPSTIIPASVHMAHEAHAALLSEQLPANQQHVDVSVGVVVKVKACCRPGFNVEAGAGKVTAVHNDGTFDIKYVVGRRKLKRVERTAFEVDLTLQNGKQTSGPLDHTRSLRMVPISLCVELSRVLHKYSPFDTICSEVDAAIANQDVDIGRLHLFLLRLGRQVEGLLDPTPKLFWSTWSDLKVALVTDNFNSRRFGYIPRHKRELFQALLASCNHSSALKLIFELDWFLASIDIERRPAYSVPRKYSHVPALSGLRSVSPSAAPASRVALQPGPVSAPVVAQAPESRRAPLKVHALKKSSTHDIFGTHSNEDGSNRQQKSRVISGLASLTLDQLRSKYKNVFGRTPRGRYARDLAWLAQQIEKSGVDGSSDLSAQGSVDTSGPARRALNNDTPHTINIVESAPRLASETARRVKKRKRSQTPGYAKRIKALPVQDIRNAQKHVGRSIAKKFDGFDKPFHGTVREVWKDAKTGTVVFHVVYTDNDEEDLSWKELQAVLVPKTK